jgi:hypothetical protein
MQVDGRVLLMHITYLFQVNSVSVSAVYTWISGPCAHAVKQPPPEPGANCLPDETQSQGASPRESAALWKRLRELEHRGQ